MTRRRTTVAWITTLLMAVIATGSLVYWGAHVRSTTAAAALAKPPTPSPLTALVERRVVSATAQLAGTVTAGSTVIITAPPAPDGMASVVTKLYVKSGDRVAAGQVIADVSGFPVIVLPGAFPMYRPFIPGISGPDVVELQSGLRSAGLTVTDPSGLLGTSTTAALQTLFSRLGYSIPQQMAQAAATPDVPTSQESGTANKAVSVPVGQIVFVPQLPAEVSQIFHGVGALAGDNRLVALTHGAAQVRASLGDLSRNLVKVGQRATLDIQGLDKRITGTVAQIDEGSTTTKVTGDGDQLAQTSSSPQVVIDPADPLPATMVGQTVSITLTLASTSSPVLAVPVSAITMADDGSLRVDVPGRTNIPQHVRIEAGLMGDGYVEIRHSDPELREGTPVILPFDAADDSTTDLAPSSEASP